MKFDLRALQPALLVIDMQAVFISASGPFRNTGMGPVVARLNTLLDGMRQRRVPILFCNYVLRADGTDAGLLRGSPHLAHVQEDSPTIGIDPRIARHDGEEIMVHARPGAFHGTALQDWLARRGCDAVILAGVSLNNAISTTAREAFARDLPAIVVRDCVAAAPFEPEAYFDAWLQSLETWTAEVADSGDIIARLGEPPPPRAQ